MDADLLENVGQVVSNGALAQEELIGDLFYPVALEEFGEDLQLSRRKIGAHHSQVQITEVGDDLDASRQLAVNLEAEFRTNGRATREDDTESRRRLIGERNDQGPDGMEGAAT